MTLSMCQTPPRRRSPDIRLLVFRPIAFFFRLSRGTPVAVPIVIRPGIQVNAIEGDTLRTDRNHAELRPHLAIEAVLIHAEVRRRVAQARALVGELRELGGGDEVGDAVDVDVPEVAAGLAAS